MKNIFLFCLFSILITMIFSCSTVIRRWPDRLTQEKGDRVLDYTVEKDIFTAFLWTTPPLYAQILSFNENGKAKFMFGGNEFDFFILDAERIGWHNAGSEHIVSEEISGMNYYYNLDILGKKTVTHSRMVPQITTTESSTEEGTLAASVEWVWVDIPEQVIDIPEYKYYLFDLDDGARLVIYKIPSRNGYEYYIQNVSFLSAREKQPGFWGIPVDIRILFIDSNSNGFYLDENDRILFNTWNPYEQNSSYQEIANFIDNQWYHVKTLREEFFLTYIQDAAKGKLLIKNANSAYINNRERGRLTVTNVTSVDQIFINGARYGINEKNMLVSAIEYGVYRLTVMRRGHLDFIRNIEINNAAPWQSIEYIAPAQAGEFVLVHHGFRNLKLTAINDKGETITTFNNERMSLSPGRYKMLLSGGQGVFVKDIEITLETTTEYDFSTDSISMKPISP